jgi:L-ascorbate metabolism protein UlaG (beta-lactamase superfamily)
MRITLIGHMTVLLEIDGVRFLTDPWFGPCNRLEKILAPRLAEPSITPDEITEIDAMLVSHNHIDHFDQKAIELARRTGCMVIGSRRVIRRAEKCGLKNFNALSEGDMFVFKGIRIHAVNAEHPLASDAIGFVIEGSRSIYFSGDTRLKQKTIYGLMPFTLDVALVQAACAYYQLFGKDGMDLRDATHFAQITAPKFTVPLHLDCSGKWLDLKKKVQITRDKTSQVNETLKKWELLMNSKSLGAKVLIAGEKWDPDRVEADVR